MTNQPHVLQSPNIAARCSEEALYHGKYIHAFVFDIEMSTRLTNVSTIFGRIHGVAWNKQNFIMVLKIINNFVDVFKCYIAENPINVVVSVWITSHICQSQCERASHCPNLYLKANV